MYFGSVDKYNKLIKNRTIHGFTAPWLAVLSSINNKHLKGGFKKGDAFIRESKDGEIENLNENVIYIK